MSSLLAGKTAVITGASSGIGRAIALSFAAEGADRHRRRSDPPSRSRAASRRSSSSRRAGGEASFETVDVAAGTISTALIAKTVARHGRLDIMVNNAATYSGTALLDTSAEQWEQVMTVNLTGMFYGCKRAIQQMITQEPRQEVRGRVINLGSQHGIVAARRDSPYGVSKAGAIYLTKQIAVDYAKDLIVCNCISPGKIVTGKPGLAMDPAQCSNSPASARRGRDWDVLKTLPMRRVFLASDRATFITGSNLVVDGGWLAA